MDVKRKITSFFYYIYFDQSNRLLLTIEEGFCGNYQVGLQVQTLTPDIVKVGRTILYNKWDKIPLGEVAQT